MAPREDLSQGRLKLVTRAWAVQWDEQRETDRANSVYTELSLLICY